jgi:hypothetical protein
MGQQDPARSLGWRFLPVDREANAWLAAIVEGDLGVERNGLNIKAVDIAEFAKIVKIVEPATDVTGARFAFGIFIYQ